VACQQVPGVREYLTDESPGSSLLARLFRRLGDLIGRSGKFSGILSECFEMAKK
jgi:hypothetical protein